MSYETSYECFTDELKFNQIKTSKRFTYNVHAKDMESAFKAACHEAYRELRASAPDFDFPQSLCAYCVTENRTGFLIKVHYTGPMPPAG